MAACAIPLNIYDISTYALFFLELDTSGKVQRVAVTFLKIVLLLGLLYMFICSLSFLSSAFRLLGGKTAGNCVNISPRTNI